MARTPQEVILIHLLSTQAAESHFERRACSAPTAMSSSEWNSSSAVSCGGDGEGKVLQGKGDTSLIILSSRGSFTCPESCQSQPGALRQRVPPKVRCTHQICQRAARKHPRSPKPQPAAIKVLHRCRGKNLRPPEGQRETQLPACHILSGRVIPGNKTALTHLCGGCRDQKMRLCVQVQE